MLRESRFFGIVSEFNPFHFGHEYIIAKARDLGATHVICVMSGNFVQRGEPAIFSKWARAKAAVLCGADLVIELPTPYAMAGAEKFAGAAVGLINSFSCVDSIVFGAENASIPLLSQIADYFQGEAFAKDIKEENKNGISFAAARSNAAEKALGKEYADIIKNPNNILAVEYIKKLHAIKSEITPLAVKRINSAHDSEEADGYCASAIRKEILKGNFSHRLIPEKAFPVFEEEYENAADISNAQRAVLSYLRSVNADKLKMLCDISEGIENKIISSAKEACSIDELYSLIKSKRYSHARIRRLVLSAFLQMEKFGGEVPYIKVLAFNEKGEEIMRKIKESSALPIITKHSDADRLSGFSKEIYMQEIKATDLYYLFTNRILPCGEEQRHSAVKVK